MSYPGSAENMSHFTKNRNFTTNFDSIYNVPVSILQPPSRQSYDTALLVSVAAVSSVIFMLYIALPLLKASLPKWLRPFAHEERPESSRRAAWNQWTLILAMLALAGLAVPVASLYINPWHPIQVLELFPWLSAALLTALDRPVKTPRLLLAQYFLLFAADLFSYSLHFLDGTLQHVDPFRLAGLTISASAILIIGNMPIRDPSWDPTGIAGTKAPPTSELRSPEDNLTLFQFWTMRWVHPMSSVCRIREIGVRDVWQLPYEFQHNRLYLAFRELQGRLLPCLVEANGLDLSIAVALAIVERVAEVSNIRLTSQLYRALDTGEQERAVFWCLVMFCVDVLRQLAKTTSSWYGRKAYERSRGETFIALFGKLLTRAVPGSDQTEKGPLDDEADSSAKAPRPWYMPWRRRRYTRIAQQPALPASNAKVVNLVRGDTYEISQRFWEFSKLISQPIKVVFTIYYLIDIMGWPSSVGFGLMLVFLAVNSLFVKLLVRMERARTSYSDRRAQAVAHFVESSRALKLNGWTSSWTDRIMKFRASEMGKRLQQALTTAAISTTNVTGGVLYPLSSICLYTLVLKRGLPNDVIWPSLQLFSQLEGSVKEAFDLISAYWKATIPVERVHQYMDETDRDEIPPGTSQLGDIRFYNASFSWPCTDVHVLKDIDLSFPSGLTVIRGKVGSGKSSLLLAALNEMELRGGDLSRPDEPVAYAQQLPWLQNKTIQENIIFQEPFEAGRYKDVLRTCHLRQDLKELQKGDQTKLEEGGIGLSGGQKARVALARALYSRCRILLLDDPLAALDHDTASAIVSRLFQGSLSADRTIVMVTHRDDLVLRRANQVVDLIDGRAHILTSEKLAAELEKPVNQEPSPEQSESSSSSSSSSSGSDSSGSQSEEQDEPKEEPEDDSKTGSVAFNLFRQYMSAGGWTLWILLAVFYGASRYCDISRARLLESWGEETGEHLRGVSVTSKHRFWGLPDPSDHTKSWLYLLAGLSGGQVVTYGVAQVLLARISINAAQGIFQEAISRVSKARFRYYDTASTGMLKNRLIADMGMVDGGILSPLESFVYNLIALVLSLVAITTHQPALLAILSLVAGLFVYFFRTYTPVSRCLRRMEMRYLTPIISNIGVMQDGLVTIRALRVERYFQDKHLLAVDDFQKQDHFFWSMAFWLDFRLSITSAAMRAGLILFMVWNGTPASAIGFVLTQTTTAMSAVQQLCERFAQLQLDAVSLERVDMLNSIPEEDNGDEEPPEDWPRPDDDVCFEGASFRYDAHLETVLKRVSFTVPGGSTCAVLGRTGSGKSTVANALLVTDNPFEGRVRIGQVDLAKCNRTTLRNRITFIQQDPVLFPGTLRDNLDPQGTFSDAACARAIESVLGPGWGLGSAVDAGGKNLSQGQRQLVGIGRAILRRSGLVILDEATASIDRETAATVQRVLREELAGSTVITIAHRLEAVEDASWCLRLDGGELKYSGPARLEKGQSEGDDGDEDECDEGDEGEEGDCDEGDEGEEGDDNNG